MRDLSIRHRLALGFGLVVGLTGIVALLVAVLFFGVESRRRIINQDLVPQITAANALSLAVDHQGTGLRGYVTSGDPRFLVEYKDGIASERSALQTLEDKMSDPEPRKHVADLKPLLAHLHSDESATFRLLQVNGRDVALAYHLKHIRSFQEVLSLSSDIASYSFSQIESETRRTGVIANRLYILSLVVFIIALGLALISTSSVGRSVTRPANWIARAASAIAQGDYQNAISLGESYPKGSTYRNELSQIAVALVQMARTLDDREHELNEMADELRIANEQLETKNEELTAQSAQLSTHIRELEALTKDLMIRQSVTSVALSSLDRDELLKRLLDAIIEPLDLEFGLVMLYHEEEQMLRAVIGRRIEIGNPPYELAMGEGLAGKVAESKQVVTSQDTDADIWSDVDVRQPGVQTVVGIPLTTGDQVYGVALLGSSRERAFTSREISLLQAFAERAVVAIQRAQAFDIVVAAETQERMGRERLQAIIDNLPEAVVIAGLPDGEIVMANKAALALYGVESLHGSSLEERAEMFNFATVNGERIPSEELPISRSLWDGEVCVGEEVVIRRPKGREIVILCNTVPIHDEEGNITEAVGVFQDITTIKDQQRFLERIYESQRSIAETLQKSFLPSKKPIVAGYEIADAYISAQQDAQVGGDFYDLIEFGDGLLGVVMGDVSGKGVNAAIHAAMAKYMLRGFAHEDPQPASVLSRLNDAITNYVRGEIFITLFYGLLNTAERKMTYANGGHEQPILYKSDSEACTYLQSSGPAIGVIRGGAYEQYEVQLCEGDAFVLYTDGITEARRKKEFFGNDGLSKLVAEFGSGRASDMADQILARVRDYAENRLHDDIALLVIKSSKGDIS